MTFVLLNNALIPAQQAVIPHDDRGFRYGDGVFEAIPLERGVPYQWEFHLQRLSDGLAALKITFNLETLPVACRTLIGANRADEGILRIQISRGSGGRGYLPDRSSTALCLIETLPLTPLPASPVALWVSSHEKISPAALPVQLKLAQGLNSALARIEAQEHACFDALLLNAAGEICETSSANIFWLENETLYTPALRCGVLRGSLRAAILRLSPWNIQEVSRPLAALAGAQSVAIGNAAWGIVPVNELKPAGLQWNSDNCFTPLAQALLEDRRRYALTHAGEWVASN